jgi:hypothetical protein
MWVDGGKGQISCFFPQSSIYYFCQLFLLFFMSSSIWLNYLVMRHPIGSFPSNFNANPFPASLFYPFFLHSQSMSPASKPWQGITSSGGVPLGVMHSVTSGAERNQQKPWNWWLNWLWLSWDRTSKLRAHINSAFKMTKHSQKVLSSYLCQSTAYPESLRFFMLFLSLSLFRLWEEQWKNMSCHISTVKANYSWLFNIRNYKLLSRVSD